MQTFFSFSPGDLIFLISVSFFEIGIKALNVSSLAKNPGNIRLTVKHYYILL